VSERTQVLPEMRDAAGGIFPFTLRSRRRILQALLEAPVRGTAARASGGRGPAMSAADFAEFFFVGSGMIPAFLVCAGDPGLAILALVALLVAGCLASMADPGAPFRTMNAEDPARPSGR